MAYGQSSCFRPRNFTVVVVVVVVGIVIGIVIVVVNVIVTN